MNQTFYPDLLATSQQITDLSLFLAESGHQVTVLTGRRGYEERSKIYPAKEIWKGIEIRRVHSTGFGKTSKLKRIVDSVTFDLMLLWELLWMPKQDIVVSFTSPPLLGIFGTLFTLLKGGKNVQWLMDINPDAAFAVGYVNPRSYSGRVLAKIFQITLKKSDHVVVLDKWMRARVIDYGAQASTISIIPPWSVLEGEKKQPTIPTGEFRKQNKLENKFLVLYSGNHSIAHPLHTLLQAALRLKNEPDVYFVFSGSGLRVAEVEQFRERHKIKNILQLPWQPRELLKDSFQSTNLHAIVMGDNMSGLVHISKLYSVLSSGRPYLFIGPKQSHVGDLLAQCPYGNYAAHGDVDSVVNAIRTTKALSAEQRAKIEKENLFYLKTHFGRTLSLNTFMQEILQGKVEETLSSKKALSI